MKFFTLSPNGQWRRRRQPGQIKIGVKTFGENMRSKKRSKRERIPKRVAITGVRRWGVEWSMGKWSGDRETQQKKNRGNWSKSLKMWVNQLVSSLWSTCFAANFHINKHTKHNRPGGGPCTARPDPFRRAGPRVGAWGLEPFCWLRMMELREGGAATDAQKKGCRLDKI